MPKAVRKRLKREYLLAILCQLAVHTSNLQTFAVYIKSNWNLFRYLSYIQIPIHIPTNPKLPPCFAIPTQSVPDTREFLLNQLSSFATWRVCLEVVSAVAPCSIFVRSDVWWSHTIRQCRKAWLHGTYELVLLLLFSAWICCWVATRCSQIIDSRSVSVWCAKKNGPSVWCGYHNRISSMRTQTERLRKPVFVNGCAFGSITFHAARTTPTQLQHPSSSFASSLRLYASWWASYSMAPFLPNLLPSWECRPPVGRHASRHHVALVPPSLTNRRPLNTRTMPHDCCTLVSIDSNGLPRGIQYHLCNIVKKRWKDEPI